MPPQTLQQIRNTAVATDGFTNPVLVKQYTEAGGTLSGGRIPSRIALPGQETRAITVDDLMKPVGTALAVPPPPTPASGGGTQAAAQAKIDSYQSTPPSEDIFSKFKEMVGETPSTEDAYLKAREEADFTAKQNEAIQAKARQRTAETEFRALADSIKAAALEGEQKKQKLRAEIGEGIPTAILSRQELQVERQTAEKILPLQMQALVKQAEVASLQGNTEIAQDALQVAENNLNTLFRLKSQDAENTFNFKKELFFKALDIADKEQTRRLNAAKDKLDREREDEKEKRGAAEKWAIEALQTGDSSLAQEISELNPNSTTFYDDLARLQGRIEPKPEKPISLGDQFERFKEAFPTADITTPEGQRAWLDWQAREWEAGRKDEREVKPSTGFFDSKIESSVREDFVELSNRYKNPVTPTEEEKGLTFKTLRNLYSSQEASDDALRSLIGVQPPTEVLPIDQTAQQAASSWFGNLFKGGFVSGVKRLFGESEESIRFNELDKRFIKGEKLSEIEMEEYRTMLNKLKKK